MTISKNNLPRFSFHFWLTLGMLVIFVATFVVYVGAEREIDRVKDSRQHLLLLANELRQSSDDLARMVRTYAVTGDPIFKQRYQEILDIQEGRKPRPSDYPNIYWDIVQRDTSMHGCRG